MLPKLTTIDVTLAANGRTTLFIAGEFLHVQEATGLFALYVDGDGQEAKLQKSLGFRAPGGARFSRVDLVDLTGASNTIRLAYGDGDFRDQRTTVSGSVSITGTVATAENAPANIDDAADVTLNNGAETTLGAAPANTRARIIVADPANTTNIRIGKTGQVAAARGALLAPGASMTIPGTATPYGYASAAGQKVSQTFVVA